MSVLLAGLLLAAAIDVGPAVGEKIPSFQAVDQDGRVRTFADLGGPQGLVLLFFRSADW
jgi:peroxiredoxin